MTLLINGKVYCGDFFQEAILIGNDRIVEVGSSQELLIKYPQSRIIDLHKKLVLPGFNDSHMHLLSYTDTKKTLRLYNAHSIEEVIKLGKEYIENYNRGILKLIIANGYNDENFIEKRVLTKNDLDKISEDIPIIAYRVCGHIVSVNSKTLAMTNINKESYVIGGNIDLDSNFNPTGVLRENAISLLDSLMRAEVTIEELKDDLLDGIKDLSKCGITSISTNDIIGSLDYGDKVFRSYKELLEEKKLTVRINHQITYPKIDELDEFIKEHQVNHSFLRIGPLKLFIDGSLGAKTAYLFDNYIDDNQNGILCIPEEELNEIVKHASEKGIQVIIHAIGNQGISICLDAFEKNMSKQNPLRHAIVHVQITDEHLLERFKNLQVGAIVQPIFLPTDMNIVYERVNKELADSSYAFKTLIKNTKTSFSSDAPVEDFNPLLGIYASCTRKNLEETYAYNESEATTVKEAVDAYTVTSSYISFEENVKGKIKPGYYADLVVLSNDIFTIPQNLIKDVEVEMTIVGGRIVYEKGK